jgi:hypothetical protein
MRLPSVGEQQRYQIDPGQRGINREMIPRMVEFVQADHAKVRDYAVEIIRDSGCAVRDIACQAKAIYEHVLDRFFWLEDPVLEETLYRPTAFAREMKEKGRVYADCASVNTALLALLGAVGIRGVFVFGSDGKRDRGEPVVFHVWSGLAINGKMFFFEPTSYLPAGKAHKYKETFVVDPWSD